MTKRKVKWSWAYKAWINQPVKGDPSGYIFMDGRWWVIEIFSGVKMVWFPVGRGDAK